MINENNDKDSEMTIDKLAIMVAKGFENIETGFEGIETRMATKEDIKNMATKSDIEGLKNQIEGVNKRIDDLAVNRVKYEDHDKLESKVGLIEEKIGLGLVV